MDKPTAQPDPSSRRRWLVGGVAAGALAAGAAGAGGLRMFWPGRDRPDAPGVVLGDGVRTPAGMAWVPGGRFLMGSDHRLAQPNERPAHPVEVRGFWIDTTHVTNDQFAAFVAQTGYLTTAERKPDWETIRVQLPPGVPRPPDSALVPGAMVFVGTARPVRLDDESRWWRFVTGANWRQPLGPGSSIDGRGNHPVVQVSYEDALAYAKWAGKQLPTEAEWEFAARGGLEQATYAWGDELLVDGQRQAHYWDTADRTFPVVSPQAGGAAATLPVASFPANGYGLHDMTGNAWQWVADWYRADQFRRQADADSPLADPRGPQNSFDPADRYAPADAPKRVIRGGSFLCNEAYCLSYRPSARRGADPFSPMSHLGFRLVRYAPLP